jgi:hypothetical protein
MHVRPSFNPQTQIRRMYISEQLINPTERRLRLSTQLGVEHVVLDNRGTDLVSAGGTRASCARTGNGSKASA